MHGVPNIELNDGHEIPQLGFGVFKVEPENTEQNVLDGLEIGYRHVDTAQMYRNEEGVGKAIEASALDRDEIFVTTKLANDRQLDALAALEESLEKLRTDYVDLYLIHWPKPEQDQYVQAWLAMEEAQRQGLVRSIGVSNFAPEHLERLAKEASVTPAINQIEVHPTLQQREYVEGNEKYGIVTESWSPLGRKADLTADEVKQIAKDVDRTEAQVLLRWHIQKGYVVFPKSDRKERLAENFAIFDFQLSREQMATLDGLEAGNRIGPDPRTNG